MNKDLSSFIEDHDETIMLNTFQKLLTYFLLKFNCGLYTYEYKYSYNESSSYKIMPN